MTKNIGAVDKTVRIVLALVFVAAVALGWVTGVWAVVLMILAVVFLVTSFTGFCPIYKVFGGSTRSDQK